MADILNTPLTAWHASHGAKMAPFAGWNMPIQYEGILAEHRHTRESASVFDICHMGEFIISGQGVKEALMKAVSHSLETLAPGRCRYGFILNEKGGVIDDCIIYNLGNEPSPRALKASLAKTFRKRLPRSTFRAPRLWRSWKTFWVRTCTIFPTLPSATPPGRARL